jgi:hypothetical protein
LKSLAFGAPLEDLVNDQILVKKIFYILNQLISIGGPMINLGLDNFKRIFEEYLEIRSKMAKPESMKASLIKRKLIFIIRWRIPRLPTWIIIRGWKVVKQRWL